MFKIFFSALKNNLGSGPKNRVGRVTGNQQLFFRPNRMYSNFFSKGYYFVISDYRALIDGSGWGLRYVFTCSATHASSSLQIHLNQ